ncbi:MAG: RNase H family protein [Eubacteriales bacterium]
MYRINIYLEIEKDAMQTTRNKYGYVLSYLDKKGNPYERCGFGERIGTKNQVTLSAMIDALKRVNQSCEIHIHTQNDHVCGMMDNCIDSWVSRGFVTAKGKEIANLEEWQQVAKLTRAHLIKMEKGYHEYTEKLKYEMRRHYEENMGKDVAPDEVREATGSGQC